jgi:alanine racemase
MSMSEAEEGEKRPTRAIVSLGAIRHNIGEIRRRVGRERQIMAVVKADGYGHGSVKVSRTVLKSGADCLGVALPEEGIQLRVAGIKVPILVLSLIAPGEAHKVIGSGLEQTVCSLELAEALDREAGKASTCAKVHVKVDTGMGRIGLSPRDVLAFLEKIGEFRHLRVVGIFSHFATADETDKTYSRQQIEVFERVIGEIRRAGIEIPRKHMANSAAILNFPESYYDLVRPGIIIYGLYPSSTVRHCVDLRPAMTLKTRISFLKTVPPGTAVSYGRIFVTSAKAKIATLPVGYGDGYSRLLSGRGEVLVRGRRVPLVGRVCMDMCMVDVSGVPHVEVGDEVILFGEDLSADEVAAAIGTISYEVLCAVDKRVPRIYVDE